MTIQIEKYVRKTYPVDVVMVKDDNLEEVAAWCRGDVRSLVDPRGKTRKYVKVRVHYPLKESQTQAFVGDRVLFAGNGFKVYSPRAFENSFEPANGTYSSSDYLDGIAKDASIQAETFNGSDKTQLVFEDGTRES